MDESQGEQYQRKRPLLWAVMIVMSILFGLGRYVLNRMPDTMPGWAIVVAVPIILLIVILSARWLRRRAKATGAPEVTLTWGERVLVVLVSFGLWLMHRTLSHTAYREAADVAFAAIFPLVLFGMVDCVARRRWSPGASPGPAT